VAEIPDKDRYKLSEICRFTDTQPYVLRFWESEFPQLGAPVGGEMRTYSRRDIDLVMRIKQLLYDEQRTIAGAREVLDREADHGGRASGRGGRATKLERVPPVSPPAAERPPAASPPAHTAPALAPRPDVVERERYDNALEAIEELRLRLREAEQRLRRAEGAAEHAAARLARLLEMLEA
jgi:DNA-binding transcriptional MerR regulator